jgi:hypothetical protein
MRNSWLESVIRGRGRRGGRPIDGQAASSGRKKSENW